MVEETGSAFIVRTANRLVVSLIYFDNEPRRRSFTGGSPGTSPGCRICSVPGEKHDLIGATKGSQLPGALAGRLERHRLFGREDVVLERHRG
jgi:hypothetical protein